MSDLELFPKYKINGFLKLNMKKEYKIHHLNWYFIGYIDDILR